MTFVDAKKMFDDAPEFDDATTWLEPQDLIAPQDAPETYPVEALPDGIRQAVQEVHDFVQCPVALVANAAIAALSIVGQSLADVRRTTSLSGPIGLYFLSIAESGERKSSCDNYFSEPIHQWEKQQRLALQPEIKKHDTAMRIWNAKIKGLQGAIEKAARTGKPCPDKEQELEVLEQKKPEEPRIPRLIYCDATPEALAFGLAKKWPSGGVMSSEAGVVLGGAGMSQDSVMRNLGLLNGLWDGQPLQVDRKTSESFVVHRARLTMGLAVQPDTVRRFFEQSKGLARGTGFMARFLVANPSSTQGNRPFKEAPTHWPDLAAFRCRMTELLAQPTQIDSSGAIVLTMLDLSPEAKAAWVRFHDDVEVELKAGGDMEETRDVASKAADNVARMAALFHVYEHGVQGKIGVQHVQSAAAIVGWHLYEARRFLGAAVLPRQANNAVALDAWLIKHFQETKAEFITIRDVQRLAPNALRKRQALDAALVDLTYASRIRQRQNGKQHIIEINPALLRDNDGVA